MICTLHKRRDVFSLQTGGFDAYKLPPFKPEYCFLLRDNLENIEDAMYSVQMQNKLEMQYKNKYCSPVIAHQIFKSDELSSKSAFEVAVKTYSLLWQNNGVFTGCIATNKESRGVINYFFLIACDNKGRDFNRFQEDLMIKFREASKKARPLSKVDLVIDKYYQGKINPKITKNALDFFELTNTGKNSFVASDNSSVDVFSDEYIDKIRNSSLKNKKEKESCYER